MHIKIYNTGRSLTFFAACFLFAGCTIACAQQRTGAAPRKRLLEMPFGNHSQIRYDLATGTYSVELGGELVARQVYALCKGTRVYDSRTMARRRFSRIPLHDLKGNGSLYTVTGASQLQQLFYCYPDSGYMLVACRIKQDSCNYMAPFVTEQFRFNGKGDNRGKEKGDNRVLQVPYDNDMWTRYNAWPMAKADFTGSEVTAIYNDETFHGIIIGSIQHDTWKTGVKIKANSDSSLSGLSVFGGLADSLITHDSREHGYVKPSGDYCLSPEIMIGRFNDWREGMEIYAHLNLVAGPRFIFNWTKPTPIGWNSWGAIQDKLTYEKAKGVIDFLYDSCRSFRDADSSLFIDLDSFWDNMIEGGLDGNVTKLKDFAAYCRKRGLRPGIYWAPFTDWGKSDRSIEGSSFRYPQVWTLQKGKWIDTDGGRAMDPTHPGTRDRIIYVLSHLKQLGFEMIKIDFLSHGAIEADHFYDPAVTTGMQAFRKGMELVDSVLDGSMLVYAAISPNLATARYVHMRRIACDAFSAIDNSEYTMNSTGYGWWQGQLYNFVDADHVVFTSAPDNMNRARLASSVVTGTLTTGDDYSSPGKWRSTARNLLQNQAVLAIAREGKSFRPVYGNTGNNGVTIFARKSGVKKDEYYVVVFNYTGQDQEMQIPMDRIIAGQGNAIAGNRKHIAGPERPIADQKYTARELFSGSVTRVGDTLLVKVAASDAAIYELSVH